MANVLSKPETETLPSPTAVNGRDRTGRFSRGNRYGRGNPLKKRVGKLRTALLNTVTTADIKAIVRGLVAAAKGGDVAAARELLDRVLGKSAVVVAEPESSDEESPTEIVFSIVQAPADDDGQQQAE